MTSTFKGSMLVGSKPKARTLGRKLSAAEHVQVGFGHLAAGTVVDTDKENFVHE
jgi:hypothetical protein